MTELATVQTGVATPLNTIPTNSLALLQQLGAIDDQDSTEQVEIVLHESANPIKWSVRQIQLALLDSDALASMYKQIDDEAKAVAASVKSGDKQYFATLKTLANNVRKAKSNITNVETAIKKQLDASIELPTMTKKAIIANVKGVTASIDETYTTVRAPLTAKEEADKARETEIKMLLGTMEAMLKFHDPLNGGYICSAELIGRLERLESLIPVHLKDESALVAKYQDVAKQLPDMIKNAEYQEKRDAEAKAAIEAQKKAEAKAEAAKELVQEAMQAGANVANSLAQQHVAAAEAKPEPVQEAAPIAAKPVLLSREQRQAMATAWMKSGADAGFTSEEEIAKLKLFFNMINKNQVPYLAIEWQE